jgi:integrase
MTPDRLNFVGLARHRPNPKQQMAGLATVPESVDLWNAGTFRGDQPAPLQAVSLPAALVKVTIILPRYRDPGRYAVAVTRELLALCWSDVDFENLELRVTRSIWHQVVGPCKTEASAKPVQMDSYMAEDLLRCRRQSTYASDDDYVFASETMRGKQPYWPDNLMKRHIKPVAKADGIHKNIGWHTFRHSFGTLLKANGKMSKPFRSSYGTRTAGSRWMFTHRQ